MYQYVHGGDIYDEKLQSVQNDLLDYSSNINPLGIPASVKEALGQAIDRCDRYPDPFCRDLANHVASFEGVREEQLFFTNGATDLFFRLVTCIKPKKALVCAPTFADYERALNTVGCHLSYYPLKSEKNFQIGYDYLDYIEKDLDLLFLCNPANPTGQIIPPEHMIRIVEKAARNQVLVVVDECFMDLTMEGEYLTAKKLLNRWSNLIIVRAFTKNFALPGVRLGYGIFSKIDLIPDLRMYGQDWSVSTMAQAAGIAATREREYLIQSQQIIRNERDSLAEELNKMDMEAYPSYANYILFRAPGFTDLKDKMLEKNILIRSCSNYRNLGPDYYRIGVKDEQSNRRLIMELKAVLKAHRRERKQNG
jgi:threonine-phosphate decarboxylase